MRRARFKDTAGGRHDVPARCLQSAVLTTEPFGRLAYEVRYEGYDDDRGCPVSLTATVSPETEHKLEQPASKAA